MRLKKTVKREISSIHITIHTCLSSYNFGDKYLENKCFVSWRSKHEVQIRCVPKQRNGLVVWHTIWRHVIVGRRAVSQRYSFAGYEGMTWVAGMM